MNVISNRNGANVHHSTTNHTISMTATEKKMTTLKDFAATFRPKTKLDVVMDSLNQAWRRAQIAGNLSLGKFDRNRDDLNSNEIDFALDWFKANSDETTPSVQTAIAPQIGNEMRDEIKRLKVEKTNLIHQHQTALTKGKAHGTTQR